MSIELKIKSKSLAVEAKIIRHEENKLLNQIKYKGIEDNEEGYWNTCWKYSSIRHHRIIEVRNEARATILARAYLKGMPYKAVESKRNENKECDFKTKIVPRVVDMVKKYCYTVKNGHKLRNTSKEDVMKWIEE